MSDADLITKLNSGCVFQYVGDGSDNREVDTLSTYEVMREAADRIEALAAEVERGRFHSDRMRSQMESFRVIATRLTKELDAAERALAEAVEILASIVSDYPFAAGTCKAFGDDDDCGYGSIRAARDFITAQEKEKGK